MNSVPAYRMTRDARPRPELWRLGLGVITVLVIQAFWIMGLILTRSLIQGRSYVDAAADTLSLAVQSPSHSVLFLTMVAGIGLGTFVAARLWQGRRAISLIGPGARTLRHGVLAAAAAFSFLAGLTLVTMPFSDVPLRNLGITTWLAWLPLGVLALILQTGGEELFFRGYLQSQLSARFTSPIIALGLPSLLFGLAHYVPTLPPLAAFTYVLIAATFGLLAADLTARTGSIGAAWGFHFANNALSILFVAPEGSITGLALWRTGIDLGAEILMTPLVSLEIFVLLAIWALIRRVLRV